MSTTSLERARAVERPSREAMLQRDSSVHQFWGQNRELFSDAWKEWEVSAGQQGLVLDRSLYDSQLRDAIEQAWEDPRKEAAVRDLWTEVFPNAPYVNIVAPQTRNHSGAILEQHDATLYEREKERCTEKIAAPEQ